MAYTRRGRARPLVHTPSENGNIYGMNKGVYAILLALVAALLFLIYQPQSSPLNEPVKISADSIDEDEVTAHLSTEQVESSPKLAIEDEDWRLLYWTRDEISSNKMRWARSPLTEQQKKDAFAFDIKRDYYTAICNKYFELYQVSEEVRLLILGQEVDRDVWMGLLNSNDPATIVNGALMLSHNLDLMNATQQEAIIEGLKRAYIVSVVEEKYIPLLSLLQHGEWLYKNNNEWLDKHWGYAVIMRQRNPSSNAAQALLDRAKSENVDLALAEDEARKELELLGESVTTELHGTYTQQPFTDELRKLLMDPVIGKDIIRCWQWDLQYSDPEKFEKL